MRIHRQISWSLSQNLILPMYHGTIVIPQNRHLFRFPYVSWHYRYSQITVYFGLQLFVSRSLFISARLCIMAPSAFLYHRLFQFCQSITASVFIPYREISHYCRHVGSVKAGLPNFPLKSAGIPLPPPLRPVLPAHRSPPPPPSDRAAAPEGTYSAPKSGATAGALWEPPEPVLT